MKEIQVYKPLLEKEELTACNAALELGWLGMGSYVSDFEAAIKKLVAAGDREVAAVSTGHAALHLGLLLAGVQPGDEVITPSFNNIADFQAILATGASPVFCDIDEETLGIDLNKAEELVGPKTKAVIVMDYFCYLAAHDRAAEFAQRYKLRVIHDAAHSFGAKYKGRMVGSFSDITMFSFDPVKSITCIDGGALVVRTKEELEMIHELRLIGMTQPSALLYQNQRAYSYDVRRVGFRYHMANLHAAIGLAQIGKIERIGETRRAACRYYSQRLRDVSGVRLPNTDFADVIPFLYLIRVPAANRRPFREFLKERGVDTGVHWPAGHWFTLLRDCRRGDLSVTDRVATEIVSLPLHSDMERAAQDQVVDAVRSFFDGHAR